MSVETFSRYRFNKYSQNGEDGIIEYLLSKLPEKDKICVEFGTLDGIECSNTLKLVSQENYKAYYIEGDDGYFEQLKLTMSNYENVIPLHYYVGWDGDNSLDAILKKAELTKTDFDLLSVDVDGLDYKIWEAFVDYYPKIVIIEINSSLSPSESYSKDLLSEDYLKARGVNFMTMVDLAKRKGYTLVTHTGNCIFIRNDLVGYVPEIKNNEQFPLESLFNRTWFRG